MSSFWKDAGFTSPPEYREKKKGSGRWIITYNEATGLNAPVRSDWIEYPEDISSLPSSPTMIITYSEYPEVTFDDIQKQAYTEFLEKMNEKKESA